MLMKMPMSRREIHFGDHLEYLVAFELERLHIKYFHESERKENNGIDFYLPKHDIYVEVKRFHTSRTEKQLEKCENILVIQGLKSVHFLRGLKT